MDRENLIQSKIFITGHNGMVGNACYKLFKKHGFKNIIIRSKNELDLRNLKKVEKFFKDEKPSIVINAAAKVGGIWANNHYPYEFLMNNMLIQNNLIKTSHENEVTKFIFLGSSCIYPRMAKQPLKEEYLLSGPLEKTNEYYALAKITGVKLCQSIFEKHNKQFISIMPTNLYGPNDNFDPSSSHVLPAMIYKLHNAKINLIDEVELWGDGSPMREFMHVKDMAKAILFACENSLNNYIFNVGSGDEISIKNLAQKISEILEYKGKIKWNVSMPNGTPRKLLDSKSFTDKGWTSKIKLEDGIRSTYEWYLKNETSI